ncbi:MAG: Phosphoenolpyruvate carboxykinase (GTP) [Firmicutes bacterium ADurb.Bin080]|jgi:phosphoenolpyruvate carboxykinase (GTP)|nr:MAG: Phosphoenolpyruvate carboxykinase (GTP) [Firmicutes bacterium ADurb.Bin080]
MTNSITNNKEILDFIDKYSKILTPDRIVWIDGTKEQKAALTEEAASTGEIIKLNEKLLPGCVYHRTAVNDVARVEHRTFICSKEQKNAGPTNNWMDPESAYKMLDGIATGGMKGRTMYIIPYSMGKIGSPFAKYGIELTDSIYVVLNMLIMTRVSLDVLAGIEKTGEFVKGIHSKVKLDLENRYICHFPEDNLIYSLNSGYGGNVLLGKKCFALRIASYQAWKQGWMAEHMLILGVQKPDGEVKYICAAFPSACGKTNLAMLIPPETYTKKGYKVFTVGDDIAWLRPGKDGRLYAINPENGFFGVAPGTNMKSNPNALISTQKDTIFTNVVYIPQTRTVWWEGLDKNPPKDAEDWIGNKWYGGLTDSEGKLIKGANPNSRFTSPAINCPCISSEFENPQGVPVSAIIFGGRRAKAAPLVYEAHNWEHGVFIGSIMASETTAAASGAVGVVRHDPMAMLPFCGYNMADYFAHWLNIGAKLSHPPRIFNVNWFRLDNSGDFIWPGFGDNMRVLDWILRRCEDAIDAVDSPIGFMPKAEDINLEGLDFSKEKLISILDSDKSVWTEEAKEIENFYTTKFGDTLPKQLYKQLANLKERLK